MKRESMREGGKCMPWISHSLDWIATRLVFLLFSSFFFLLLYVLFLSHGFFFSVVVVTSSWFCFTFSRNSLTLPLEVSVAWISCQSFYSWSPLFCVSGSLTLLKDNLTKKFMCDSIQGRKKEMMMHDIDHRLWFHSRGRHSDFSQACHAV